VEHKTVHWAKRDMRSLHILLGKYRTDDYVFLKILNHICVYHDGIMDIILSIFVINIYSTGPFSVPFYHYRSV